MNRTRLACIIACLALALSGCFGALYEPGVIFDTDVSMSSRKLPDMPLPSSVPTQVWLPEKTALAVHGGIRDFDSAVAKDGRVTYAYSTENAVYMAEFDGGVAAGPDKVYIDGASSMALCASAGATHLFFAGDGGVLHHRYFEIETGRWINEDVADCSDAGSVSCFAGEDGSANVLYSAHVKTLGAAMLSSAKWNSKLFYFRTGAESSVGFVRQVIRHGQFSAVKPDIAGGSDGTVYMAWIDNRDDDQAGVYFKLKGRDGWGKDTRIAAGYEERPTLVKVVAGKVPGTAYVVWLGGRKVYFRMWSSGIWGDTYVIGEHTTQLYESLAVAVDPDGIFHAIWGKGNGLVCRQLAPGGWLPELRLASAVTENALIRHIDATVSGNDMFVSWVEERSDGKAVIAVKRGWRAKS